MGTVPWVHPQYDEENLFCLSKEHPIGQGFIQKYGAEGGYRNLIFGRLLGVCVKKDRISGG